MLLLYFVISVLFLVFLVLNMIVGNNITLLDGNISKPIDTII
jgi:hypothetical protein